MSDEREKRRNQVRAALNRMDESDRKILMMRHFEQLENKHVSEILGVEKVVASRRYVQALGRLKEILDQGIVGHG